MRSLKVEGEAHKLKAQYFIDAFYVDVVRTDFRYIYLDILDQNNNSIPFEKELSVRLHFRVKK